MALISSVGRYLADIFFEPLDTTDVHRVHIVDLAEHYRPDFGDESISRLLVAGSYDDAFAKKLADLKYHGDRRHAEEFALTLAGLLRAAGEFDLVAVPPSPLLRRVSRLGYLPMADIVGLAGYAPRLLPTDAYELSWHRGRQAPRSREERLRAFSSVPIRVRPHVDIAGKRVVIADDVLST